MEKLKIAQDKKNYVDNNIKECEYEFGNKVFLKLSLWKGVVRFERRGKLSPLILILI